MLRRIRHALEGVFLWLAYWLFRLMPMEAASAIGGFIGRRLAPLSSAHKIAQRNLARAMPELTEAERKDILRRMWDNLGRVIGEYPHLSNPRLTRHIILHGGELITDVRDRKLNVAFISGHFGNWEITPRIAAEHGLPLMLLYRPANNPAAEAIIRRIRLAYHTGMVAKGTESARRLVRAIRAGKPIGALVDQKMNDGIPVPFFGRPAMTSPSIAKVMLTYGLTVLPVYVRRLRGVNFEVTVNPPLVFAKTGNHEADVSSATLQMNQLLEEWIRRDPAQWFWIHNRWPKD